MPNEKAIADAEIRATSSEITAFISGLDKFLSKELRKILSGLTAENIAAEESAAILGSLYSRLEEAGLNKEIAKLKSTYADQLRKIDKYFKRQGVTDRVLSDVDRDVIENLISFDAEKLTSKLGLYVDDTKAVLMRSVLSGSEIDVDEFYDGKSETLMNQMDAELNTMISTFNRTVTANKAQELGFELMQYLGPDDQITRPFCRDVLSRDPAIYTIDEILEMDNGQGLPVLESGGGWNCRHQWRPITIERAIELGWEPDDNGADIQE